VDELGKLFEMLESLKPKQEDEPVYENFENMSPDEIDEYKSIYAEGERMNEVYDNLMREKKAIGARTELFWFRLRRNHKIKNPSIRIDDSNNKFIIQLGKESADASH
jgi:hypothetical protein